MIELKNITKYYGNFPAVTDISFKIERGEIVGLLGPNGVGKTTLLSNILNFTDPLTGQITYNGNTIDSHIVSESFLYIGENNFAYDNFKNDLNLTVKKIDMIRHNCLNGSNLNGSLNLNQGQGRSAVAARFLQVEA